MVGGILANMRSDALVLVASTTIGVLDMPARSALRSASPHHVDTDLRIAILRRIALPFGVSWGK